MKRLLFKILCSKPVGQFIYWINNGKIPCVRWSGFRFTMPKAHSSYMNHASVFWGFYESAELRLINKYLSPDLPVIELGGSLGIVSSHIISRLKQPFTIVEANPMLIETIRINTGNYNHHHVMVQVVNKAISYAGNSVSFAVSNNNTESSIANKSETGLNNKNIITVPATTLAVLTKDIPSFTLVCDIEGAEVELLIKDKEGLNKCRYVFMEVHKTSFENKNYTQGDVIELLLQQNFKLKEYDGHVVYMEKI